MERLNDLFRGYLDNRLSVDEYTELWQLMGTGGGPEALSPELRALWMEQPAYILPDAEWEEKMRALLNERASVPVVDIRSGRRRVVYVRWAVAAAIVMVVVGGFFIANWRSAAVSVGQVATVLPDIRPGTNGAVLRMASGRTIVLDTARNGQLSPAVMKSDSTLTVKGSEVEWATLSTPRARQQQLRLPDGTKVWLNASSSIYFPSAFTGAKREVAVTGEAYFEVARNTTQPFIVKVGASEVEVLGTEFNLMAYPDEGGVQTTLISGAVRVTGANTLVLRPGQQSQLEADGRIQRQDNVDVELVTAWKNGWQTFRKADLATIMRQVERWYDVDVDYKTQLPANRTFSGEIPRNVNLSELLKVFERPDLHFEIDPVHHRVVVTNHPAR